MDTNPPEQTHNEMEIPAPSFWPFVLAFGLLLMAAGVIFSLIISVVGVVVLLVSLVGWTLENRADSDAFAEDTGGDPDTYAGDEALVEGEEARHE